MELETPLNPSYGSKILDERLYYSLNLAQQGLRQRVDTEAVARTGLTSAQTGVLMFVARHEGCTLGKLAAGIGVKNAAITGLVARTEKTGCITSSPSPTDARATQLHLTRKGRAKLRQIAKLNAELNERLRDGFSPDEIAVVLRFLQHVRDVAR